jgi:hypothetical protein
VQHEMNPIFPICSVICFFIFGYVSFLLCPLAYLLTQNAVHRCSRCLQILGIKRCFGIPDDLGANVSIFIHFLSNFLQIYHIRLGKCAIVMERIYAILLTIIIIGTSVTYAYNKPYTLHHSFFERPQEESITIENTWSQYLESCSGEKIIENQVHALHLFSQTYENNIVNWDGYYIDTKQKHRDYSMFGNEHFMSILVKMDPSESENFADIVLSISQEGYKNNKETLDKLVKGDHLNFKAKIKTMGNEFKLHHLHLAEEADAVDDTGHTKDLDHIEIHASRLP